MNQESNEISTSAPSRKPPSDIIIMLTRGDMFSESINGSVGMQLCSNLVSDG